MNKLTRRLIINCNESFSEIIGGNVCTMLCDYKELAQKELFLPFDNQLFGKNIKTCLENSQELSGDEWVNIYGSDTKTFYQSMQEKIQNKEIKQLQQYGYKTKNALYKNMNSCSLHVYDDKVIKIIPFVHEKLTVWDWSDIVIKLHYNAPDEILGATVRYAFAKCRGKGPYAKGTEIVSKKLFPDGVPNSLEKYLASIDPDYEKWLIKEESH